MWNKITKYVSKDKLNASYLNYTCTCTSNLSSLHLHQVFGDVTLFVDPDVSFFDAAL